MLPLRKCLRDPLDASSLGLPHQAVSPHIPSQTPYQLIFPTSLRRHNSMYLPYIAKVWVDKNTRVMTQGFTGKTGTFHASQTIAVPEYAPTMVGGVSPGKGM